MTKPPSETRRSLRRRRGGARDSLKKGATSKTHHTTSAGLRREAVAATLLVDFRHGRPRFRGGGAEELEVAHLNLAPERESEQRKVTPNRIEGKSDGDANIRTTKPTSPFPATTTEKLSTRGCPTCEPDRGEMSSHGVEQQQRWSASPRNETAINQNLSSKSEQSSSSNMIQSVNASKHTHKTRWSWTNK